jgi:hypothetical protein
MAMIGSVSWTGFRHRKYLRETLYSPLLTNAERPLAAAD